MAKSAPIPVTVETETTQASGAKSKTYALGGKTSRIPPETVRAVEVNII